jgi:hypothetical protein
LQGSRQLQGRTAALVLAAVEKRGRATGRVRLAVSPAFTGATPMACLKQNVALGSTVSTAGRKRFTRLEAAGLKHVPRRQPRRSERRKGAKSGVPLADRTIGSLQQWLTATYMA